MIIERILIILLELVGVIGAIVLPIRFLYLYLHNKHKQKEYEASPEAKEEDIKKSVKDSLSLSSIISQVSELVPLLNEVEPSSPFLIQKTEAEKEKDKMARFLSRRYIEEEQIIKIDDNLTFVVKRNSKETKYLKATWEDSVVKFILIFHEEVIYVSVKKAIKDEYNNIYYQDKDNFEMPYHLDEINKFSFLNDFPGISKNLSDLLVLKKEEQIRKNNKEKNEVFDLISHASKTYSESKIKRSLESLGIDDPEMKEKFKQFIKDSEKSKLLEKIKDK